MVATTETRRSRVLDWVTILRHGAPHAPLSGQITKIEPIPGDRLYWLRAPDLGGVVIVPHSRVARMLRHPGPIKTNHENA